MKLLFQKQCLRKLSTEMWSSMQMSWVDRAEEFEELRLGTVEELREWREKRRLGKVKVELDHEYVDKA